MSVLLGLFLVFCGAITIWFVIRSPANKSSEGFVLNVFGVVFAVFLVVMGALVLTGVVP